VRRELRLLRTTNMEGMLRPCFHVISGRISKQKIHVLERYASLSYVDFSDL